MSDCLSDPEIVRGLQAGHSDAWTALCQRYGARLWQYVARLVGRDASAVADVFQETMLGVAKGGRTLRDRTHLWAWLTTIAYNQSALHWRSRYKQPLQEPIDDLDGHQPTPAEALQAQEEREQVRQLLAGLPTDDATLLVAKYVEGLSIEEIVRHYGGSPDAVRSRLARARRAFRKRFASARAS